MNKPAVTSEMSIGSSVGSSVAAAVEEVFRYQDDGNESYVSVLTLLRCLPKSSESCYNVGSINSTFHIIISECIYLYFGDKHTTSPFKVVAFYKGNEVYTICKFHEIRELMNGNEENFLAKVFVKIDECPKQEELRKLRLAQISEAKEETHDTKEEEVQEESLQGPEIEVGVENPQDANEEEPPVEKRRFWRRLFNR